MMGVQDGAEHQKQFQAAVDVIQQLPKNGPYRPSYEVMLRFYSYYKQATLGPCNIPRPGFWDPIGRYKWDAWKALGNLSQDEAMAAYILEMKRVAQKVIDTVPIEEASSEMFHHFEPLYQVIPDMPRPPEHLFKKIKGEHEYHLKEESCQSKPVENGYIITQLTEEETEPHTEMTIPQSRHLELDKRLEHDIHAEKLRLQTPSLQLEDNLAGGTRQSSDTVDYSQVTSDSETEVFCDSLDQLELDQDSASLDSQNDCQINSETSQSAWEGGDKDSVNHHADLGRRGESTEQRSGALQQPKTTRELPCGRNSEREKVHTEMTVHVTSAVCRLQEDMQTLQLRLSHLEALVATKIREGGKCTLHRNTKAKKQWWHSLEVSRPTLLFLVLWPFFVQWLVHKYQTRKR
ncbi:acyl-CoA-binding domain-containing protein 4 isoform X1 [Pleurodeles waltl]|uniref:acyl-CoA-binding domain-containing protein 4 isoform X1 n=1 Tax=Pleurodeles waltl TaxID=8319 RepID=UPI0037097A7D